MSILVIAEHDNSNLKGSTLNTITAASLLDGEISLLIAGSNMNSVIEEAQTIDGVSKILTCDSDTYSNSIAEDLSSLIIANSDGYTHILAPATTFGKNICKIRFTTNIRHYIC
jgi:electron transfer flavoprotein alpha subunit